MESQLVRSSPVRFLFLALAAGAGALAAGFVAYVLLLPDFIQRTPTGIIEPRWLAPTAFCCALVLSSFAAQRCLDWGPHRDSQLAPSIGLGLLIGVLSNLGWSVRLLVTDVPMAHVVRAWSLSPLGAAVGGT